MRKTVKIPIAETRHFKAFDMVAPDGKHEVFAFGVRPVAWPVDVRVPLTADRRAVVTVSGHVDTRDMGAFMALLAEAVYVCDRVNDYRTKTRR